MCGLKHNELLQSERCVVTPYVGVWIETRNVVDTVTSYRVTPYVGVWIETASSALSRGVSLSHTLRGCVD